MKKLFRDLKNQGKTLMISSHVLSDIEELCDRAVILKQGESRREVLMRDLHQENSMDVVYQIILGGKSKEEVGEVLDKCNVKPESYEKVGEGALQFEIKGQVPSETALHMLIHGGCSILEFRRKQRSLEDVFMEVSRS